MFRFVLLSLFLSTCVFSEHVDPLFSPCSLNDLECVKKSCTELLTNAAEGVEAPYNIEPVDPIEVPTREFPLCCDQPPKTILRLENTKIYGFKDVEMLGISLNRQTKKAVVSFAADFKILSKITNVNDSTVTGEAEYKAKTKHVVSYDFNMIKDNNGVEFLDVGQENTTCELIGEIEVKLSPDNFKSFIEKDMNIAENAARIAEVRKEYVCRSALFAMKRVMQAFRQSAKVTPASQIFN